MSVRALVLEGDGINCENETEAALREVGFRSRRIHASDFAENGEVMERLLGETQLLVIPGGFSYADELGSGRVLALRLRHTAPGVLEKYFRRGGAALGICNGFQVLTQLGIFGQHTFLAHNQQGKFMNRWVGLEVIKENLFTQKLAKAGNPYLELPVRHGEGRLVVPKEGLPNGVQVALQYSENINGSWNQVAGLSAFGGRVFGLMPHPEAFWSEEYHPALEGRKLPLGTELFLSAYEGLKENP